jgi:hypothetical protein
MRFWQILVALGLIVSSGLGLLIMSGNARGLMAPSLQAELVVQDFPLPPDMGVDPALVADFMARELQQRLEDDVAIRLTVPEGALDKVRDIVLPRLMNVVAVQSMMNGIPELSELLDMGSFRRTVSGEIFSHDAAADVALTVPGALLASVDGTMAEITTTSTGMTALKLGEMTAGQNHHVVLWLDESTIAIDLGRSILLGASEGERGRVLLSGDRGWFGADVEALRWGRWLIGSVLAVVLVFGIASLMLPALSSRTAQQRRPDARATEQA